MESDRSSHHKWPQGGEVLSEFESKLCQAAETGDAARIRAVFAQHLPNGMFQKNKNWQLPIVLASRTKSRDAVQALVDCGLSVNSVDKNRRTPLLIAAREGLVDSIHILLAAGANINARDCKDHSALRLAVFGGHLQVVQALLAAGRNTSRNSRKRCDVNSRCKAKGATALHIAASKGDIAITEALVAAGADRGAVDIQGRSPLVWAARYNRFTAVRKLLELGAHVDASALTFAAVTASPQLLKEVLSAVGANAPTLLNAGAILCAAASCGELLSVKELLAAGFPVDAEDSWGSTALLCAADSSRYPSVECIRALLAAGASVDKRDGLGRTALMCVAKGRAARTPEIIEILLAAGASVHERDRQGQTALMYAAQGDSADAIRALAAAGASIHARDNRGRTALHGFARHGQRVAAFKALLEAGADTGATDTEGVTVLLAAIKAANAGAVSSIMAMVADSRADVVAASRSHPTPLDLMLFENGSNWLQCYISVYDIVELVGGLSAAGCPVDTRLPASCGDPGLQPSTLETWLARMAKHGWPASSDDREVALQVTRALLPSAAAQGSQGRPELLAAAEAVGSPELVAAVQKILPVVEASPNNNTAAMPGDQPIAGNKRRPGRRSGRKPKAAASTSHQPVPRPAPAAVRTSQLARGRFSGTSARLRARPALLFILPLARVGFAGCF